MVAGAAHDHHPRLAGHEAADHLVAAGADPGAAERGLQDGQEQGDGLRLLDDVVAERRVVHAHGQPRGEPILSNATPCCTAPDGRASRITPRMISAAAACPFGLRCPRRSRVTSSKARFRTTYCSFMRTTRAPPSPPAVS